MSAPTDAYVSDDDLLQELFRTQPRDLQQRSCASRYWSETDRQWQYVSLRCRPDCACALWRLKEEVPVYRVKRTAELKARLQAMVMDAQGQLRPVAEVQRVSNELQFLFMQLRRISPDGRAFVDALGESIAKHTQSKS